VSAISSVRRRTITPASDEKWGAWEAVEPSARRAPPPGTGPFSARGYAAGDIVVGRYFIRERVGVGPLGVVYRGEDLLVREDVAVRVLWPELFPDDRARVRFLQGATVARGLSSRYVGNVRDAFCDEIDDKLACVLVGDFLRRPTLASRIAQRLRYEAPFLPIEVAPIVSQLGIGLSAMHRAGIVHANLKARNVFFSGDEVRIGDLGVASALPGALKVGVAGDVYALAAITAEMLGLYGMGPVEEVSPPVRATINRALSRNPAERFPDVDALASALLTAFERGKHCEPEPGEWETVTPAFDPVAAYGAQHDEQELVAGDLEVETTEVAGEDLALAERWRSPSVLLDEDELDSQTPITELPVLLYPAPAFRPAPAPAPAPVAPPAVRVPLWLVLFLVVATTALGLGVVLHLVDAHVQEHTAIARVEKARLLAQLREEAAARTPAPAPAAPVPAAPAAATAEHPAHARGARHHDKRTGKKSRKKHLPGTRH
jgi:hypothetical protein